MPKAILFDLDGTLVQTREASWELFSRVNDEFRLGVRSQEDYFRLMDGNLFQSLRDLAGPRSDEVAKRFLDLLKAEYDPPFVPGIVDVVRAIAGVCSLAVVSSNTMVTIRRILEHAELQHCFSHVFGGDVEPDKRACVRRFLADADYSINRHCSPAYVEERRPESVMKNQVILVTDTVGDVVHAVECGVRAIGVAWGMHSEKRLLEAGAEFVAVWPQEILSHLFPEGLPATACSIDPARSSSDACACDDGPVCTCEPSKALHDAGIVRRHRRQSATARLEERILRPANARLSEQSGQETVDAVLLASIRRISQAPGRRT